MHVPSPEEIRQFGVYFLHFFDPAGAAHPGDRTYPPIGSMVVGFGGIGFGIALAAWDIYKEERKSEQNP
eukprot:g14255.t1